MKLIFLIYNTKNPSGGSYSLFKFAEYLAKRGHIVTIFADLKPIYFYNYKLPKMLKIKYRGSLYGAFKGSSKLDQIWRFFYKKAIIEPFLKKSNPEFLIGFLREEAIAVSKLSKKFKITSANFIFENPEWMKKQLGSRFLNEYKGKFKKSWEKTKLAYQETDILIPNSELTKKECSKWLNRNIENPIYPGVDIINLNNKILEERQIIYIGRLNEYKNVDEVIKALAKIKNPPKFVIVGSGEEEKKLRELAEQLGVLCEFKGRLTDQDKWVEIRKSMFMVFPSSFEGFGMSPAESLICEKPCICTDIPVFKEVYGTKVEYFEKHHINDLSKKIELLSNNWLYRKKKGKIGRRYVLSRYAWEKAAESIEKMLLKHSK